MSQFRLFLKQPRPAGRTRNLILVCGLFLAIGCGKGDSKDLKSPLEQVQLAAQNDDFKTAKKLAKAIPPDSPDWAEAQVMLGRMESMNRYLAAGLPYYESVPRDGSPVSLRAARAIAEIYLKNGSLSKAGENYEYVLQHSPDSTDNVPVHEKMASILVTSGQRFQAETHLLEVVKHSKIEIKDLVLLTEPDRRSDQYTYLKQCYQRNAQDPFVNLGMALEEAADHQFDQARQRVSQVVLSHPEIGDAQALLGELTLDTGLEKLQAWNAQLPNAVKNHPGVWYVRGLWARQLNENRVAARCFWETIRQRPHHRRAMYQLGQVMVSLDPPMGAAFSKRAEELKEYSDIMEQNLISQGRNEKLFRQMVSLLKGMGREWEAWAWVSMARDMLGPSDWPGPLLASLSHVERDDSSRFLPDKDLSRRHDLSSWPDFDTLQSGNSSHVSPSPQLTSQIRFVDQSADLGVEFSYFQSPDTRTHGVRIFESTGGGIGVIDFDLDGCPDVYLTQGENWNPGEDQPTASPQFRDRLYRNQGSGFQDVTELAGFGVEDGYGQGCSCGDFNNDGLIDLYVANIGGNQLLVNNGDGTFSDATPGSGIQGQSWTTSCLIMDLNADGNPDLYDVNYLQGESMFRVECGAKHCSVRDYAGCPDQVQLSQGDGTFIVVPDATPTENSKGLGIVALFVGQETKPSLFIANDQVLNHFLRPTEIGGKYLDQATLTGLAVNMDGKPTACMGVASGDLNHDRLTDLFVTNFEGEANNLYLQRTDGFFDDAITGTGLMAAGIPYVGWGTQFLDADNDRELDMVVSNGHVADFGESGVQYQMPTQFFHNLGHAKFQQLLPAEVGPLFERNVLGRSLATIDWNRDNRIDFIQSSIAAPTVFATNQTEGSTHSLSIRLHARTTARDALGTVAEVRQGDTVLWQQLTAGDGYQVTNERQLHFGLGNEGTAAQVVIHWPSGTSMTYESVPVDTTLEVVEGNSKATVWRGMEPGSL